MLKPRQPEGNGAVNLNKRLPCRSATHTHTHTEQSRSQHHQPLLVNTTPKCYSHPVLLYSIINTGVCAISHNDILITSWAVPSLLFMHFKHRSPWKLRDYSSKDSDTATELKWRIGYHHPIKTSQKKKVFGTEIVSIWSWCWQIGSVWIWNWIT